MADKVTTVTSLLPFQQQALEDLWKQTQTATATPLPVFQGDRVADLTGGQTRGINQITNFAQGEFAQPVINRAIAANDFWSDPSVVFNLQSLPGYGDVRAGIEQSVGRMLTEQALPEIRRGALLNNSFGSGRQGIAEGLAVGRTADALASQLGNLDLQTAQMLLNANQQAIGRAPGLVSGGGIPGNLALQAQGILQAQQQAEIDAERQKFQEEANRPYFALDQLRASLGQFPSGVGQQTQKQDSAGWLDTLGALILLGKSGSGGSSIPGWGGMIPIPGG